MTSAKKPCTHKPMKMTSAKCVVDCGNAPQRLGNTTENTKVYTSNISRCCHSDRTRQTGDRARVLLPVMCWPALPH